MGRGGRAWRAGSMALCVLVGAGCGTHFAPDTRPGAVQPMPMAAAPASALGTVQLTFVPAVPRALDPTTFTVYVPNGVNARSVTADLLMPGMSMPSNVVVLAPAAPGTYTGQGRFTMTGDWAVAVTVQSVNGKKTTQTFPLVVR